MILSLNWIQITWAETVKVTTFPGWEPQINLWELKDKISGNHIDISTRITSFNDLGHLLVTVDAIKRIGGTVRKLIIPYFPGARQDRYFDWQALTIQIYTDLINSLWFEQVVVFDPHSGVLKTFLNNMFEYTSQTIWENYIKSYISQSNLTNVVYISPDKWGVEKINLLAPKTAEIIYCTKCRDSNTWKLSGFQVNSDSNLQGKHGLVIDDICDWGWTVIWIAKELQKRGIWSLSLFVTHWIFSKWIDCISEYYTSIHTTDSFKDISDSRVTVQVLESFL